MSYSIWHEYGYGIKMSEVNLDEVTEKRIKDLLSHAPKFEKIINDYFEEVEIKEPLYEDYAEYDQEYHHGIAYILGEVIKEETGIVMETCDDYNGEVYILYVPSYPWNMTEIDRHITKEKLEEVFKKYLGIICDTMPDIDYQECENGG